MFVAACSEVSGCFTNIYFTTRTGEFIYDTRFENFGGGIFIIASGIAGFILCNFPARNVPRENFPKSTLRARPYIFPVSLQSRRAGPINDKTGTRRDGACLVCDACLVLLLHLNNRPNFIIIINKSFYYLFKPELSIIYNIAYAGNYTVINASSLGFSAIILRQTSTLVRALYPSPRARGFTARARAYRFVYVVD